MLGHGSCAELCLLHGSSTGRAHTARSAWDSQRVTDPGTGRANLATSWNGWGLPSWGDAKPWSMWKAAKKANGTAEQGTAPTPGQSQSCSPLGALLWEARSSLQALLQGPLGHLGRDFGRQTMSPSRSLGCVTLTQVTPQPCNEITLNSSNF